VNQRKIDLFNALNTAEAELKVYSELVTKTRESIQTIRDELDRGYKSDGSNYTAEELASVRRRILAELGSRGGGWMYPRDLVERISEHCPTLVMRELHKLAKKYASGIMWNRKKGPASQYARYTSRGELYRSL